MRRIKRGAPRGKDANQDEIVEALEKVGCTVLDLSAIGGVYDILAGRLGINYLIEIKNPETRGKLSKSQEDFYQWWHGQRAVATTVEEALFIVGVEA